MPALDFPANPTNGQVYSNWIFSTSKGAWQAKPMESAKTVTSDVPPANPADGDQWFSTVDGVLYVYVVDIDGGQWVESRSAIISDGYYSPNYIINGGFDIWQRGTGPFTTHGTFSADRWNFFASAGSSSISRSTDVPSPQFAFSLSYTATNATLPEIYQRIESRDAAQFAGQTVTVSFWAKSTSGTAGYRVVAYTPTAVDNYATVNVEQTISVTSASASGWARYSVSFVASANAVNGIGISLRRATTTSSSTTLWTGVQIETGSVATPFRRNANSLQGELAACQRYYYRIAPGVVSSLIMAGQVTTSTQGSMFPMHPVTMRANPTLGFSSVSHFQQHTGGVAISTLTAMTQTSTTPTTAEITTTAGSGFRAGDFARIQTSNAAGWVDFSAEL